MLNLIKKKQANQNPANKARDFIDRGSNNINDLIAPDSISNEKTFYAIGDRLVRTLIVTGYPKKVRMGWLDNLYSYDADIDISLHITPWPNNKVIKTLNKRIGQYISTIGMDEKSGKISDIEITTALEDAEMLREKLSTGSTKFFYQSIYVSVSARYLEELDQLTDDVESLCGSVQMTTRIAVYRQDEAFLTVLPVGNDQIKKNRNFDTDSLSTCFPLVSAELTDMRGRPILYGINQVNNSLVMFDRFKLSNHNSVTLASSGAGKSYAVKLEAIRYFLMGTKITIIDPQGEYKELVEELGGQYINLSGSSKDKINPLDIYEGTKQEEEDKNFLTTKILDVYTLTQVMLGRDRKLVKNEVRSVLQAVQDMYAKFGITPNGMKSREKDEVVADKDFITIGSTTQIMPTLTDFDSALKEQGADGLEVAQELDPYIHGVMNMFNGETNVDLENDFVVFGVKDLEESMQELAMFICLEYVWNKIKSGDLSRRLLIIDEAWILMKSKSSADFITKVAKVARKFNAGLSVISQNIKDFIDNGGEAIINNSSMQILLKQRPQELQYLEGALGVTESEKTILKSLNVGEALIYAEQNKTLVSIISNNFEHKLCNTTST